MPKLDAITQEHKQAICDAIREKMPLAVACDLVGVKVRTAQDHCNPKSPRYDASFHANVKIAKAVAIRDLVGKVEEQKGAWKLLKNLGRKHFKEYVEVVQETRHTLFIEVGDEKEEIDL